MGSVEPADWQIPTLTARLRALPGEKCALFAASCAAHAISAMPQWVHAQAATRQRDCRQGIQQLQASLDRLLGWVCRQEGDALAELRRLVETCLPDPAHLFRAEIDLFVVVRRSWECVAAGTDVEDRVWRASQAALESYVAVGQWYIYRDPANPMNFAPLHDRVPRQEARRREPMCVAELRFQCAALDHVEQVAVAPELTYAALFAAIGG
jgi:hypothetical protein